MKKWFLGAIFGLVVGVSIAFSIGLFASPETATRNVTISVSGLPSDRTVDVWNGSEKLASFPSDQTVQQLVVSSNLDKLVVKSEPIQRQVYNEQTGREVTTSTEPGIRYFTEKSEYDLSGTANLNIVFKKQYNLGLGTSATVRGTNMEASTSALEQIQFNPASRNGFYDAGTTVIVTVPKMVGMQFAYWVIKDAGSDEVSADIREFSSADNPLHITLDQPTYLFSHFVGEWEQLPAQKESDGKVNDDIVVQNLVEGQKVTIIQDGNSVLEKTVEIGGTEAKLQPGTDKQLNNAQIIITAPDGKTVIFESPVYDNLQPGDRFFF